MSTCKEAKKLLSSGDFAGALGIAGPLLKRNHLDLNAWYLSASALFGLGETEIALKNLESLAMAIAEKQRPILAMARIKEIESLGGDTEALLNKLAAMYSALGDRVEETEMSPPPLPMTTSIQPWIQDEELIPKAKEAMAVAWGDALTLENAETSLPYIPLLSSLKASDFIQLAHTFERHVFEPGEVIVKQDAPGDAIYVIAEGEVAIIRRSLNSEDKELARLGPGAFFGEMAIVSNAPRAAEVQAFVPTIVLRAAREKMEELAASSPEIGNVLIAFCHERMINNLMTVSPILSPVPVTRRPDVIGLFSTDYFEVGDVIIEEGQEGPGLFLIVSGHVHISKKDEGEQLTIANLGPGDLFGEISLLMRRPSTATVIAQENTAVLFLPSAEFTEATREYPELLKGAFDIALEREEQNNSILANSTAAADDLVLV